MLVETITNPLMRVGRHREIVAFARANGLTSVVDNTFASPVNFRPVAAGFDLVFNSATKYLNGHSDLVAGSVAGAAGLVERVRHTQNLYGGSLDPHAGYLLARSLKTLGVRVRQQNANAQALAELLSGHPKVAAVQLRRAARPPRPRVRGRAAERLRRHGELPAWRAASRPPRWCCPR